MKNLKKRNLRLTNPKLFFLRNLLYYLHLFDEKHARLLWLERSHHHYQRRLVTT